MAACWWPWRTWLSDGASGPWLAVTSAWSRPGLSVDFARPIAVGEWVEAQADIQQQTRRTVFANCYLVSTGQRAVRASGIYTITGD